jgi:cyclic pyranopterin monophosphate synthase
MNSVFSMIDVGKKPVTHRRAIARGEIQLSKQVCYAIRDKSVPKGDVLTLAEIAGIGAAKRTSDILPLCHPLMLDAVQVGCEIDVEKCTVIVTCEVSAHARTGVEMEALSGVSASLLCIYDLTKGLDKGAIISGIILEHKEGGKSGTWNRNIDQNDTEKKLEGLNVAVLTVSDSSYKGDMQDISGEKLVHYLQNQGGAICGKHIIPDDIEAIRKKVEEYALKDKLDLVMITGGTGLGPRDVTPEAILPLWTKTLPGFGEIFRNRGILNTPNAWLSRAEAGLIENTFVVLLPGSPLAVNDGIDLLDKNLSHIISIIRGGGH